MLTSDWLTKSNAARFWLVFDWLTQNNVRFWLVESSTLNYSWIFSATLPGEAWPAEEHDGTAGQRCWGAGAQTQAHVERICGGKYLLLIGWLKIILISDWLTQNSKKISDWLLFRNLIFSLILVAMVLRCPTMLLEFWLTWPVMVQR